MTKIEAVEKFGKGEIGLDELRRVYGMSITEFADRYTKVHPGHSGRIENNVRPMTDKRKLLMYNNLIAELEMEETVK